MRQRCNNCINWIQDENLLENWGRCPTGKITEGMVLEPVLTTREDYGCRFWDRKPADLPHKKKGPTWPPEFKAKVVETFLGCGSLYQTAIRCGVSRRTARTYVIAAGYGDRIYTSSWLRPKPGSQTTEPQQPHDVQREQIGY